MPLPKDFWTPKKKMGPVGAYAWYIGRGLIFATGVIALVFISQFGHDLYNKVTGKKISQRETYI